MSAGIGRRQVFTLLHFLLVAKFFFCPFHLQNRRPGRPVLNFTIASLHEFVYFTPWRFSEHLKNVDEPDTFE